MRDVLTLPVQDRALPLEGGGLRVFAPAKINLNLLVGPVGADGYHPIDSIMAKICFYDCIDCRPRDDGRIVFSCRGADCGDDEKNLALRAARLLAAQTRTPHGVSLNVVKHIPPGKGLGGGSSDAAAVLWGLDQLWSLDLPQEDLACLAAQLGSDVPLFLGGPSSRITGRGERVQDVSVHPFHAVLCMPDCSCPTPAVYRAFDQSSQPASPQLEMRLLQGPPSGWRDLLVNQLAPPARVVTPELADFWDTVRQTVSLPVLMTGSGSAIYVLCDDRAEADAVARRLPEGVRNNCVVVRDNPW